MNLLKKLSDIFLYIIGVDGCLNKKDKPEEEVIEEYPEGISPVNPSVKSILDIVKENPHLSDEELSDKAVSEIMGSARQVLEKEGNIDLSVNLGFGSSATLVISDEKPFKMGSRDYPSSRHDNTEEHYGIPAIDITPESTLLPEAKDTEPHIDTDK